MPVPSHLHPAYRAYEVETDFFEIEAMQQNYTKFDYTVNKVRERQAEKATVAAVTAPTCENQLHEDDSGNYSVDSYDKLDSHWGEREPSALLINAVEGDVTKVTIREKSPLLSVDMQYADAAKSGFDGQILKTQARCDYSREKNSIESHGEFSSEPRECCTYESGDWHRAFLEDYSTLLTEIAGPSCKEGDSLKQIQEYFSSPASFHVENLDSQHLSLLYSPSSPSPETPSELSLKSCRSRSDDLRCAKSNSNSKIEEKFCSFVCKNFDLYKDHFFAFHSDRSSTTTSEQVLSECQMLPFSGCLSDLKNAASFHGDCSVLKPSLPVLGALKIKTTKVSISSVLKAGKRVYRRRHQSSVTHSSSESESSSSSSSTSSHGSRSLKSDRKSKSKSPLSSESDSRTSLSKSKSSLSSNSSSESRPIKPKASSDYHKALSDYRSARFRSSRSKIESSSPSDSDSEYRLTIRSPIVASASSEMSDLRGPLTTLRRTHSRSWSHLPSRRSSRSKDRGSRSSVSHYSIQRRDYARNNRQHWSASRSRGSVSDYSLSSSRSSDCSSPQRSYSRSPSTEGRGRKRFRRRVKVKRIPVLLTAPKQRGRVCITVKLDISCFVVKFDACLKLLVLLCKY